MTETALQARGAQGRTRPPRKCSGSVIRFSVGGQKGYLLITENADGTVAGVTIKIEKQGSTIAGMMDATSIAINHGLSVGAPLTEYITELSQSRFHPAGPTDDEEIPVATSVLDYVARRLAIDYLPVDTRTELGILTAAERRAVEGADPLPVDLTGIAMSASTAN
jgi:ribonucleoside-diphosphate reductase alpha chain